jgi:hypothetical protein
MKKAVLLLLVFAVTTSVVSSQKLIDIYKNGPVKLTADKSYGAKNNWETLFNLYYDTLTRNVGREEDKRIVLAPDGSLFMSHKNRHEIWKFGQDGNFVKSFGAKGGKAYQFPMMPTIQPVVDGKYVFTCDVNARLKFFDLDGNYYKSITLKYMTGSFRPLGNGIIMLEGNVLWHTAPPEPNYTSLTWRHVIVKLNIYTGEESIIYSYFDDYSTNYLKRDQKDTVKNVTVSFTPPVKVNLSPATSVGRRPVITFLQNGQFVKSDRTKGEMTLFDNNGKQISNSKIDIEAVAVTEQDVKDNYEKTKNGIIKEIERIKADKTMTDEGRQQLISQFKKILDDASKYKDIDNYDKYLPFFSNIITDDEGNILVFEYTAREEKLSNIFNVIAFDNNGQKLARTSFTCDDYDLSFSESTFVISKGYVYAVAKLKHAPAMPLRLVKFKISN